MDIHPPEGPANSFREFLIHIAIVTVGILIALGLEGVEETLHNRHLVRETRENFRSELEGNQSNLTNELENTREMKAEIDGIVKDLPTLRLHPDELRGQVGKLEPSFYYLSSSRWDAALSTGAMAHMSAEEVGRYADSNILVRSYSELEAEAAPVHMQLESYFDARPSMTPAEVDSGVEKLLLLGRFVATEIHVGEQLQGKIKTALSR